jgi:hypothetical protein
MQDQNITEISYDGALDLTTMRIVECGGYIRDLPNYSGKCFYASLCTAFPDVSGHMKEFILKRYNNDNGRIFDMDLLDGAHLSAFLAAKNIRIAIEIISIVTEQVFTVTRIAHRHADRTAYIYSSGGHFQQITTPPFQMMNTSSIISSSYTDAIASGHSTAVPVPVVDTDTQDALDLIEVYNASEALPSTVSATDLDSQEAVNIVKAWIASEQSQEEYLGYELALVASMTDLSVR